MTGSSCWIFQFPSPIATKSQRTSRFLSLAFNNCCAKRPILCFKCFRPAVRPVADRCLQGFPYSGIHSPLVFALDRLTPSMYGIRACLALAVHGIEVRYKKHRKDTAFCPGRPCIFSEHYQEGGSAHSGGASRATD